MNRPKTRDNGTRGVLGRPRLEARSRMNWCRRASARDEWKSKMALEPRIVRLDGVQRQLCRALVMTVSWLADL